MLASHLVPDALPVGDRKRDEEAQTQKRRAQGKKAEAGTMHLQAEEHGEQRREPSLDKLPQSLSWNLWSINHVIFRTPTHESSVCILLNFLKDICQHRTCAGSPSLST